MSNGERRPSGLASRILTVAMLVVGGMLLFPGIVSGYCVLVTSPANLRAAGWDPILLLGLVVGLAGLALVIWGSVRFGR